MKKRRWLLLLVLLLVGTAVLVGALEPTGTIPAYLAGEPFYRDRPLRYWREMLRDNGQQGAVSTAMVGKFWDGRAALPVLLACARDTDRDVRWPAVFLLGDSCRGMQQALTALVEAVEDQDVEVRLKALGALGSRGPLARQAAPAVAAALRDEVHQVGHVADLALWAIDNTAALKAGGWEGYRSVEWGFSVMLPGPPEVSDLTPALSAGTLHSFQAWHKVGAEESPTRYAVAVCDYPADVAEAGTQEQHWEAAKALGVFGLGGKVVREREVEQGRLRGREHTIEVAGKGEVQIRLFWSGRRLYTVLVAFQREFLNAKAAAFFLDSFRLASTPTR